MNIELDPIQPSPVSEPAKTASVENSTGSDFLDALIKVAQKNLPDEAAGEELQPAPVEIRISKLFDRASNFFNFADALATGPQLNFLDIIFPDTSSLDFSMSLTGEQAFQEIPFFNIFSV